MMRVNSRIDEKKEIESKRKTWNKIRKQEKVQEIQEKRSKWKYEPSISVRHKLSTIFTEFNSNETVEQEEKKKVESQKESEKSNQA